AMHHHPREEEAIYVLEGTATMSIAGDEVTVPAGAIVKFPANVPHDVRNLGAERCVIMFLKVNPKVLKAGADGAGASGGTDGQRGAVRQDAADQRDDVS